MGILSNIKSDNSIEESKDVLGGGSGVLETGVYSFTIDLAYVDTSKSGAVGIVLNLSNKDGQKIRTTEYVTSGTDKGGKNYYETKDGKKRYLPGYTLINEMIMLTLDCELADIDTEEKVINIYNFDLKKEAPTKKQVITDLLGKDVLVAVNKTIKDKYAEPNESVEVNELFKFFHTETRKTVNEYRAEEEAAVFIDSWLEKNKGKVKDIRKESKGSDSNSSGEDKPKKKGSLFG